jgi:hypothetical protein
MRVPRMKKVDWDLKRKRFKLKKRIRRWWDRLIRRWKIRSYISDDEIYVVKAISLEGEYSIILDSWEYDEDYVYAYKLIAMRYGLDMSVSNGCVTTCNTSVANLYSITLKKKE